MKSHLTIIQRILVIAVIAVLVILSIMFPDKMFGSVRDLLNFFNQGGK